MADAPGVENLNPALHEAAQRVLERLGLTGGEYSQLIPLPEIVHLAAEKEVSIPNKSAWDYAYAAASELLYRACQDQPDRLALGWLRGYIFSWFKGNLNGDAAAADDLAGDTIEIVIKKIGQVRFPNAFLAWAEQIALNQFKDFLSKKNRHLAGPLPAASPNSENALGEIKRLLSVSESAVEDHSPGINPEEALLERELRAQVVDCVRRMRDNTRNSRYYRSIIIGYYFQNKSIEELSALLSLPKEKVTKLKSQALLNLRKIWLDLESQNSH